jgi:hypothetical protein
MNIKAKDLITAEEARKLLGYTYQEEVAFVCAEIRKAAEKKQRRVILYGDLWTNGAYNNTSDYNLAKTMLEDLGFVVKFRYEELQVVYMYTIVEW